MANEGIVRKSVYTQQPIEKVTSIAIDIFNAWVRFARGEGATPFGYKLKNTSGISGKYASSLFFHVYGRVEFIQESTRRSGNQKRMTTNSMAGKSRSKEYNQVVFGMDTSIAPEGGVIEFGRRAFNIKDKMLNTNYKVSKDGLRYRIIPLPTGYGGVNLAPTLTKEMAHIGKKKKSFSERAASEADAIRERAKAVANPVHFVTMTENSSGWNIPAMMPHNVVGQFMEQVRRKLGGRY